MTVTKADLITILKSFIYGSQGTQLQQKAGTYELLTEDTGLREALREEAASSPNYLAVQNGLYYKNRNAVFYARAANTLVSPITREIIDADDCFTMAVNDWYLNYSSVITQLYGKRAFKYAALGIRFKMPLITDTTWNAIYFGGEVTGGAYSGTGYFKFQRDPYRVYLSALPLNRIVNPALNITGIMPITPSNDKYCYSVKFNRASIDYYVDDRLIAIVQLALDSDTYNVRVTAPYYVGQAQGCPSSTQPWLLEWVTNGAAPIGTRSNILVDNIWAMEGDPAPPRTLHPITGGVNWEGTVVNPDITSDGIPIAGYDMKTVHFLASGAGTLVISVDYGDNAYDVYDSVAVAANTLMVYPFTADALWIKLKYTPTAAPQTITRARVLMR